VRLCASFPTQWKNVASDQGGRWVATIKSGKRVKTKRREDQDDELAACQARRWRGGRGTRRRALSYDVETAGVPSQGE